jgi:uncharacterized protein (TIGR02284 family)
MEFDQPVINRVEQLILLCEESAKRFYNAAEHVRNRGLKLILKSYIQQRVRFVHELNSLVNRAGVESSPNEPVTEGLSRGWSDIKATMTVQRQGRQQLLLSELASEETKVLGEYTQALKEPLPAPLLSTLERQYADLRTVQRRLALLAENADHSILVRLYNQATEADRVVQQLKRAGFAADDIYTTSVDQLDIYTDDRPQKRRSMRDTVVTSVLLGLLLGAGLGLLLALAQRTYFPQLGGIFTSTPGGVMIELIVTGALIGGLFALIFGLFMGRDAVEDDAYLSAESLRRGDTLVAVFTDQASVAEAERIIGLRHQFEVKPAPVA